MLLAIAYLYHKRYTLVLTQKLKTIIYDIKYIQQNKLRYIRADRPSSPRIIYIIYNDDLSLNSKITNTLQQ